MGPADSSSAYSFATDHLARLTGLTLNPETPPPQPHNSYSVAPTSLLFSSAVQPPAKSASSLQPAQPDPDVANEDEEDDDEELEEEEEDNVDQSDLKPTPTSTEVKSPAKTTVAPTSTDSKPPPDNVTLRALVTTKEAGVIIGKGGKNVADIRTETNVKAGVSKVLTGVSERILTISGTTLGVAKAFSLIAKHLLDSPISNPQPPVYADCTTIRLLVSHQLMGSIIGKGGAKIKEIQEESGAKLVISKDMLPQSTERIIEVFGLVESIKIAVFNIAECILHDIERAVGTILYNPQTRLNSSSAYGSFPRTGRFDDAPPSRESREYENRSPTDGNFVERRNRRSSHGGEYSNGHGNKSSPYSAFSTTNNINYVYTYSSSSSSANRRPSSSFHGSTTSAPAVAASGEHTQTLTIPADMVGCVIGKGGTFINAIRRQSNAKLRVSDISADGANAERTITITGTAAANAKALEMLHSQLEWERQRRVAAAEEGDDY